MFKFTELLKNFMKKRYVMSAVSLVTLSAFSLVLCASTTLKTVNIFEKADVTISETKGLLVEDVLEEENIKLNAKDRVIPSANSEIYEGMNIEIRRAVKVFLSVDGKDMNLKTSAFTVDQFLKEENIEVSPYDIVKPSRLTEISAGMSISLKRAKKITFSNFGEISEEYTHAETVEEFLEEKDVKLAKKEKLNVPAKTPLKNYMLIETIRCTEKVCTVNEVVPFEVIPVYTLYEERGTESVVKEGSNGEREVTYRISYENGREVKRVAIKTKNIKKPVCAIYEYGMSETPVSETEKAKKTARKIKMTATAYDLSYASCGKNPGDYGYGITASGMRAAYGVIAVDPKVIPLGTKLYVESPDGSWSYGYCVAGDTGGSIKGNRVDLFYNSHSEAVSFGRRTVDVYILS